MHRPCFIFTLLINACIAAAPCLAQSSNDAPAQDLAFNEFYVMPIGPRGLEPTRRLLALRGQRVRLTGYMVHEEQPTPGVFMLTPQPVQLAEIADGPADDLPATTVYVYLPVDAQRRMIPYRPGAWQLTGTLELGAQAESNHRVSYARLRIDRQALRPAALHMPQAQGLPSS